MNQFLIPLAFAALTVFVTLLNSYLSLVAKNTTKHTGANIRFIRQMVGMKQEALANRLGIAQQNVSKMEKKQNLSNNAVARTAEALVVTTEFIKTFDKTDLINT